MIKINLLPTKRKPPRKVTELQKQAILGTVILAAVAGGMVFYYMVLNNMITARQAQREAANRKVQEQENLLREVRTIEEERRKVMEKIGIIEQLKKNQQGPVRLLDELSTALPNNVDLTNMIESSGNVYIDGDAYTNEDIVRFVDNLKASAYFAEVFLIETSRASKDGVDFYRYKLSFRYKGL